MTRLNLGCGPDVRPGYDNLDRYQGGPGSIQADVRILSNYATGSIEEILALDILEHTGRNEWKDVLAEWVRVLAPGGGTLTLCCPEMKELAAALLAADSDERWEWLNRRIFGDQRSEGAFHYTGFSYPYLRSYLERTHGLVYVSHDISNYNVTLTMRKP